MRCWVVYLLPFLTACVSAGNPVGFPQGPLPPGLGMPGVEVPNSPAAHQSFALLLNAERGGGSQTLTEDSRLSAAALAHAQDMVTNRYFSHTDLAGGGPAERAEAAGYHWRFIAENIIGGFYSNDSVITAWMDSDSHRDNMLDTRAEDFGLGRVDGTWVLLLGAEFE